MQTGTKEMISRNNITLESYKEIAPKGTIDLAYGLAESLKGKSMLHINSTRRGGGVAEILHRLIPMLSDLGIPTHWEVMEGTPLFYQTTKSFHNALQGQNPVITKEMYEEYIKINRSNAEKVSFDSDLVIIHDPQPAGMVYKKAKTAKWLWRCHIDISHPHRKVWNFLREYIYKYNGAIFSLPSFAQKINIPQFLMYPSIDPLSEKNRELSNEDISRITKRYNIPDDKPIILQVSRFDRFKDPLGVIEAYKLVKRYNDCYLVLAGGEAADDPEGEQILQEVRQAASQDKDIFILSLPAEANLEINALQRAATVILQKSTKEGFGLTVAEAMWKGKPVIGGEVGGIKLQVHNHHTGFLVNTPEGAALRIRYLLTHRDKLAEMGQKAHKFVLENFLITRHVREYLTLMLAILRGTEERIELV